MTEKIGFIGEVQQGNIDNVEVPQNDLKLSRADTMKLSGEILHSPIDSKKGTMTVAELRQLGHELNDRKGVSNDKLDKQLLQTKPGYYRQMMNRRHPDINQQ